jgi:hypothetical protein
MADAHHPATTTAPRWSVQTFEAFWSDPDPRALRRGVLTDDIVGHWAGRDAPVRGPEEYVRCIAALVDTLPGLKLSVAEHARNGDLVFVRWIMRATGANGPFELGGIDRVRLREGRVAENVIVFDTAAFAARAGVGVPWA